ncbi:MAG: disulfide bond formation protein B [Actinomycetaceae bacterium]|nr:disulfide bond formation protein B [Actinomycetaceae bacterium]
MSHENNSVVETTSSTLSANHVQLPGASHRPSKIINETVFNWAVTVAVFLILALPVGIANVYLGYVLGESPCTSCAYERFGMVVVGALGLFMVRYGPHYKYVAALAFASFFFLYSTIRHWNYHVVDDVGQGFASEVFGVHTYTWGAFVFWIVMGAVALGLVWIGRDPQLREDFTGKVRTIKPFNLFQKIVAGICVLIVASNAVQMFVLNGPPPYAGKGSPPRTTFDVSQSSKFWTASLWERITKAPKLLAMGGAMPHIPIIHETTGIDFPADPQQAPIPMTGAPLEIVREIPIGFEVVGDTGKGTAAGIAYDPSTNQFGLVSSDAGMYFVEDDFATIVSSGIIDRPNGSDITYTVDATFLAPGNLVGMAWNKTIFGAKQVNTDELDEDEAWIAFNESSGDLMPEPAGRALLFTARAKHNYALSIAGDQDSATAYVVSVPNEKQGQIVISQFADDHKLYREKVLTASSALGAPDDVDLGAFYPVGADFHDGTLYVLSKAYNTLMEIDADSLELVGLRPLPEMGDFHDLAIKGQSAYVLSRDGDRDVIYEVNLSE